MRRRRRSRRGGRRGSAAAAPASEPTVSAPRVSRCVARAMNAWAVVSASPAARVRPVDRQGERAGQRAERQRRGGASPSRSSSHRRPSTARVDDGPAQPRAPRARSARRRNARSTHAAWATSTRPAIASSSASAASASGGAPARSSSRSPWISIDAAGTAARRAHEPLARARDHDAAAGRPVRRSTPRSRRAADRARWSPDPPRRTPPPPRCPARGHGARPVGGRRGAGRLIARRGADRRRSAAAPRPRRGTPPSASRA